MRSDWTEVRLDELKSAEKGAFAMGPFGSRIKSENFLPYGIPVIKGGNLNGDFLNEASFDYLSKEKAEELSTSAAKRLDLVVTHRGTIGQVGIIPEHSKFEKYIVSQSQLKLSFNLMKVNPYFVYYFLRSPEGKHRLLMNGSQVGVPAIAQALTSLRNLRIPIPGKEEQDKIVNTLRCIDDKITLLRETNTTLEAIAQAIFKSWFVDFDPVRARAEGREPEGMPPEIAELFPSELEDSELGKIPKGWRVVSVGEVADIIKGKSYKSSELVESDVALVTLKSFTRGGGFRTDGFKGYSGSYKPEQVIKPGDCVVAYTDVTQQAEVIGRAAMVLPSPEHKTLVASLDIGVVRPTFEHLTTAFLYFLLRGERYVSHIYGYTSGTTVLHLAKEGLPVYQFVLPPAVLLKKFEELAVPIMGKIGNNHLKTVELSALRDALLPRLISGMLRVIADENMT